MRNDHEVVSKIISYADKLQKLVKEIKPDSDAEATRQFQNNFYTYIMIICELAWVLDDSGNA